MERFMRLIFGGWPAYESRLLNGGGNTRGQQAEHGLCMLGGFAAEAGQIAAVVLRDQSLGMQTVYGSDYVGSGCFMYLETLLSGIQIKADQRVEFVNQIGRVGHDHSFVRKAPFYAHLRWYQREYRMALTSCMRA